MKIERVPGEGDPFADGIRMPEDGPRPDLGTARFTADAGYIEESDEPWHSTCVGNTASITKGLLDSTYTSTLPFIAPEEALLEALRKVGSVAEIDEAVAACLAAGGRKGCPNMETAEKMKKAAEKDGEVKKAPPAKVAAQGKGFDDMGRGLAKVHDNSV